MESSSKNDMKPMKVLFLSADTGGGHRASAESLGKQIMNHFPGSSYDMLDVWTGGNIWPYNALVKSYKHLSANPNQWRTLYHTMNSTPAGSFVLWHSRVTGKTRVSAEIERFDPDVIISVHPTMQNTPLHCCREISKKKGKYIPFFTVVTDLASAHSMWFEKGVDKIYVASQALYNRAKNRARIPEKNIVMSGLPIRNEFALEAEKLGDRYSSEGRKYQQTIRTALGLNPDRHMILLMGGGEGVGGLSSIASEIYVSLSLDGLDATICVVCGRNEKLKADLESRDWEKLVVDDEASTDNRTKVTKCTPTYLPQPPSPTFKEVERKTITLAEDAGHIKGKVQVIGLGFVTNMAQYMVASDVLVSKAGPGTISEAAALGLPLLLTSFLPGQEAGNVDYVVENDFGEYVEEPIEIGNTISEWLQDPQYMELMSSKAKAMGRPTAAEEIVLDIGRTSQQWLK